MTLSQGEVWWADMPPPLGYRPVVLLTRDDFINALTNVTVAPLTRSSHRSSSEVEVSAEEGVVTDCVISLDNVTTIPSSYLVSRMTLLSPERMNQVWEALHYALDVPF
ncbi:MAG: type II toxin-antitoxin system PemK/MazF family toxin [Tepidisphaeraceae bacterium]